ncbi:MAG: hypothetical protein RIS47_614, partial [Bacteroidota bacterium]
MIRILTIDGGGTRGVAPAALLAELEADLQLLKPNTLLRDWFDVFAGASTGGVICMAAGIGMPMKQVVGLYQENAKSIFSDTILDNIKDLGNIFGAEYSNKNLIKLLTSEQYFGNKTLGDINRWENSEGKKVIVMMPTFDLSPDSLSGDRNYRPRVFNTYFEKDQQESIANVIMRGVSAPTYFPIYERKFIDGGVAINNPSTSALAFAMNQKKDNKADYGGHDNYSKGLAAQLHEIALVSVGTGSNNNKRIEPKKLGKGGDWGALKWLKYLPDLLTETNIQASCYY